MRLVVPGWPEQILWGVRPQEDVMKLMYHAYSIVNFILITILKLMTDYNFNFTNEALSEIR